MNKPALQGSGRSLGSIAHTQLVENTIDVTLDGCFTDIQTGSDCFVAIAGHDLFEHLDLSGGEIRASHSLCQPFSYLSGNPTRAGMHFSNCVFQLFKENIFQQVALGSSLQRTIDVFVTIVGSEYDQTSIPELFSNRDDRFNPAHFWHPQIHQRYIRTMAPI